jgi:hypothetical protein
MEFTIGGEEFEAVFLVAPQLNCDIILGCNFLKECGIQLCFDTGRMKYLRQGQSKSFKFEVMDDKANGIEQVATEKNYGSDAKEPRTASSTREIQLADVEATDRVGLEALGAAEIERDGIIPAQYDERVASPVEYFREKESDVINYRTCYGNVTRNKTQSVNFKNAHEEKLFQVIDHSCEVNENQKLQLFEVLNKYSEHFSEKPGKCKLLKYKFDVKTDQPLRSFSRPVPFAMRNAVKNQIREMIRDDILELSQSNILNPLTVVPREGKKPRICVDARKVNQYTIPDYERTPPL